MMMSELERVLLRTLIPYWLLKKLVVVQAQAPQKFVVVVGTEFRASLIG